MRYRIWDKTNKRMFSTVEAQMAMFVVGPSGIVSQIIMDLEDEQKCDGWARRNDCIALWSTDELDRAGSECFEGDRVTHSYPFGGGKGVIKYSAPLFVLNSNQGSCSEIPFSECMVVGNIYEK